MPKDIYLTSEEMVQRLVTPEAKEAFNKLGKMNADWYISPSSPGFKDASGFYVSMCVHSRPVDYMNDVSTDLTGKGVGGTEGYGGPGTFAETIDQAVTEIFNQAVNLCQNEQRVLAPYERLKNIKNDPYLVNTKETGKEFAFDEKTTSFVPFERNNIVQIDLSKLNGKRIYIK